MGLMDMFRGGSAREQAAKAMEAKKMDKMAKEQAASDSYKAAMAEGTPAGAEKKYPREQPREFSAEQMEGARTADMMMEGYKRDADVRAMFDSDPAATTKFRDALAEKAGSGASRAALAEYGTQLMEEMFPPAVMGTAIEEEGKKAA